MSLKTLSQLTSTTAADAKDAFRHRLVDENRKTELRRKIHNPDNISLKGRGIVPETNAEMVSPADLPRLSPETLVDRALIDPAPDEWNFFDKPDAEAYNLLLNSIIVEGLMNPITLWKRPNGRYMILSGHTRESVFDELYQATADDKWQKIPAKFYEPEDLTENDARRIIILANIAQRAKETPRLRIRSYGEYARLTKERAAYGSGIDVNEEVAKVFGIHRSTVFFYRRLNNLIDPLLDRFCSGKLTRTAATALCGLSANLQNYLLSRGYMDKLNPSRLRQMKTAKTDADIDDIFNDKIPASELDRVVNLKIRQPPQHKLLLMSVPAAELEKCRQAVRKAINSLKDLSGDTKAKILAQLGKNFGD